VKVLDQEVSAPENVIVLKALREALLYQEVRALRRKAELHKINALEHLPLGDDGHFKLGK
jgi:hypothetical protein